MLTDSPLAWAPDANRLAHGLRCAFSSTAAPEVEFTVVDRRHLIYASSFPAEVVTCQFGDNSTVELLCKYGIGHVESGFGHRGGVPYESRVYRDLLTPLRVNTPRYWGEYEDPDNGGAWLIVEFLSTAACLGERSDSNHWLVEAARWIGDFQLRCRALPHHDVAILTRYTAEYFSGWADRTFTLTNGWHESLPWLPELCEAYGARGGLLIASEPTVIHGEYYPNNILIDHELVRPVDWESAAVAPGEIDLASLTEGSWPEGVVEACTNAYVAARWPRGAPAVFAWNLAAARLYLQLRWLGDNEAYTLGRARPGHLFKMRALGEELGLI